MIENAVRYANARPAADAAHMESGRMLPVDIEQFKAVEGSLMSVGPQIMMASLVVIGCVLWIVGRKLARPGCVVSGLVVGGLGGLVVAEYLSEAGAVLLPLVIGGAIGGALIAGLLFRFWIAICSAALLAILAPAATIVWQGTPRPPIQLPEDATAGAVPLIQPTIEPTAHENASARDLLTVAKGALGSAYDARVDPVRVWWDELGAASRRVLLVAAVVAGGIGLCLGLVMPYVTAATESAVVGAILIFYPGSQLLRLHFEDYTMWLSSTPRMELLTVGLITLLGAAFQWIVFRKPADKQS